MLPRERSRRPKRSREREEVGSIRTIRRLKEKNMGKASPPRSKRIFGSNLNISTTSLNASQNESQGAPSDEEKENNEVLSQERQERKAVTEARETKMKEQAKKLGSQMKGKSGVQTLPVAQLLMDLYSDHNMIRELVMKNLTGTNVGDLASMMAESQQIITNLKIGEEEGNKKRGELDSLLSSLYPEVETLRKNMEEEKTKKNRGRTLDQCP